MAGVEEDGHAADGERVDDAWAGQRVARRLQAEIGAGVQTQRVLRTITWLGLGLRLGSGLGC